MRGHLTAHYFALAGRDCPECAAIRKEFVKTLPVPSAECTAHHIATQELEDAFLKRLEDLERQLELRDALIYKLMRPSTYREAAPSHAFDHARGK